MDTLPDIQTPEANFDPQNIPKNTKPQNILPHMPIRLDKKLWSVSGWLLSSLEGRKVSGAAPMYWLIFGPLLFATFLGVANAIYQLTTVYTTRVVGHAFASQPCQLFNTAHWKLRHAAGPSILISHKSCGVHLNWLLQPPTTKSIKHSPWKYPSFLENTIKMMDCPWWYD